MSKLKRCPFCASEEITDFHGEEGLYFYKCEGCQSETGKYELDKDAMEAWNMRKRTERQRQASREWINKNRDKWNEYQRKSRENRHGGHEEYLAYSRVRARESYSRRKDVINARRRELRVQQRQVKGV